jgi:hypothetical protein
LSIIGLLLEIVILLLGLPDEEMATLYISTICSAVFLGPIGGLFEESGFRGGASLITHSLLRLVLYRSQETPLNYARFLDHVVALRLLHKVGGGYIFIHRYLLEYFAANE